MSVHEELIGAYLRNDSDSLIDYGREIGKLYTDFGLPLDMAIDKLKPMYTKEQMLLILTGACNHFVQHKRNSGATEKAIDRQRKANIKILDDFIRGKETGVY